MERGIRRGEEEETGGVGPPSLDVSVINCVYVGVPFFVVFFEAAQREVRFGRVAISTAML